MGFGTGIALTAWKADWVPECIGNVSDTWQARDSFAYSSDRWTPALLLLASTVLPLRPHRKHVCWAALFVLVISMGAYLKLWNRRKAAQRVELGLPAELKDMSIMSLEEAAAYREKLRASLAAQGKSEAALFDQAFDDLTDFE